MRNPTPEIRQAFYARLLCGLPIGQITENDLAWPNAPFMPQVGRMWLAPALMFGETATASLSSAGFERLSGIFQINVYGVLNQGEAGLDEMAARLCDLFRAGTAIPLEGGFNHVLLVKTYRSGMRLEGAGESARPVVTVSANWRQYTQKGE